MCLSLLCNIDEDEKKKTDDDDSQLTIILVWRAADIFISNQSGVSICADRRWNYISRPYIEDFVSEFSANVEKKMHFIKMENVNDSIMCELLQQLNPFRELRRGYKILCT